MSLPFTPSCNCPDFQKRAAKNLYSPYLSNQINRDWSMSNAGVDPGQYCKHIWATLISKNLLKEIDVPDDPRIPEAPRNRPSAKPNIAIDVLRGDRFY